MSIWVLFDLDGTLVDNSEGITKSTQFALDSYGYPNQPMETLKKFIGPPLHESFMEFYGFSKEQAFEAVDRYRVRYKEKGVYENRLYPGMKENTTFFMVGDRSFDRIGAKKCGVPGIGVYFGFAEPGELEEAGADYTVETTEELKTLLMKLVTEAED